jgi:hypothetical protein
MITKEIQLDVGQLSNLAPNFKALHLAFRRLPKVIKISHKRKNFLSLKSISQMRIQLQHRLK